MLLANPFLKSYGKQGKLYKDLQKKKIMGKHILRSSYMWRRIAAQKIQEINSALINFIGCGYFITFHVISRHFWIIGWPDFYVKVLGEGFIGFWQERHSDIIYMTGINSTWRDYSGKYLRTPLWSSPRWFFRDCFRTVVAQLPSHLEVKIVNQTIFFSVIFSNPLRF